MGVRIRFGLLILTTVIAAACGGSSDGGTTPSPATTTVPPNPTATNTITISGNEVNPKNIVVAVGSQVTFINNDSQPHDMESDPHPEHTDCPAINQVGFISPGQTRQTGNLTVARTCGFHDHNQPSTNGLLGSITIR